MRRKPPRDLGRCLVRFHGRGTRPERIRKPSGDKGVRESLLSIHTQPRTFARGLF
jgi:hypothetical protein